MATLSLRLPDDVESTLEQLAKATGRSKSYLALDALNSYLARESWQIAELQQALVEADAGDFASAEEVAATLEKWTTHAR